MNIDWDVIRYLPDYRRGEPRNIGVAIIAGDSVSVRFFGEQSPGRIDGRSARHRVNDVQNYREWVHYFRRKAAAGKWEDVAKSRIRRPDFPYIVDRGGTIFDVSPESLDEELTTLYQEMVADSDRERFIFDEEERSDTLAGRIERIFRRVPVVIHKDVVVRGEFPGGPRGGESIREDIRFGFGYRNGRLHLMDSVSTPSFAYSFFARAEAAYRLDGSLNFLAFYRGERFSRHEAEIEVIERYANAVNIEDEDEATGRVAEIFGVLETTAPPAIAGMTGRILGDNEEALPVVEDVPDNYKDYGDWFTD